MRYFMDTEFLESGPGQPIHLLSLALVSEDHREYYAVAEDCPVELANRWVKEHVLPHIDWSLARPRQLIKEEVLAFVKQGGTAPRFYGDYADYDWVVFCQLFGTMMDLPTGWPMYCNDLRQWGDYLGGYTNPSVSAIPHQAIEDARSHRRMWERLCDLALARNMPAI